MTKHEKLWRKARRLWIKNNPPNHQGYWECYICHKWIDESELTVDHMVARSSDPSQRYIQENLRACCWECNGKKGSKHLKVIEEAIDPNLPL